MTSGAELAKGKQLGVLPLHLALSLALCCHFPLAGEEATLPKPGRRDMVGWGQSPFLCVCQCSVNYGVGGPSSPSLGSLEPGGNWLLLTLGREGWSLVNLQGYQMGYGVKWVWASGYFCLPLVVRGGEPSLFLFSGNILTW